MTDQPKTGYPTEERYIVVHCAATRPNVDITAEQIRRYHRDVKGWADIGYHQVIRRDGRVDNGRDMPGYGAHARGTTPFGPMNLVGIGVCMAGGLDEEGRPSGNHYTRAQWHALKDLIVALMDVHRIPASRVLGHRDVINDPSFQSPDPPKACPCFDVQEWLAAAGIAPHPEAPLLDVTPDALALPPVYHVRLGDTFAAISRSYGVPLAKLAQLNPAFPTLYPGDEVRLS